MWCSKFVLNRFPQLVNGLSKYDSRRSTNIFLRFYSTSKSKVAQQSESRSKVKNQAVALENKFGNSVKKIADKVQAEKVVKKDSASKVNRTGLSQSGGGPESMPIFREAKSPRKNKDIATENLESAKHAMNRDNPLSKAKLVRNRAGVSPPQSETTAGSKNTSQQSKFAAGIKKSDMSQPFKSTPDSKRAESTVNDSYQSAQAKNDSRAGISSSVLKEIFVACTPGLFVI